MSQGTLFNERNINVKYRKEIELARTFKHDFRGLQYHMQNIPNTIMLSGHTKKKKRKKLSVVQAPIDFILHCDLKLPRPTT